MGPTGAGVGATIGSFFGGIIGGLIGGGGGAAAGTFALPGGGTIAGGAAGAAEGFAMGAAAGGVVGAAIGNAIDNALSRNATLPCHKDDPCYIQYLEDTAWCGEVFTDDTEYDACMDIALLNWERCTWGQERIDPNPRSYPKPTKPTRKPND